MKYLILLFILIFFSNLYAAECTLKNARVTNSYQPANQTGTTYFVVGNLERQIQIPIKEPNSYTELTNSLKKSYDDKGIFLNLKLEPYICGVVMNAEPYQSYLVKPKEITSTVISHSHSVDCIECMIFNNAPINIQIPPMKEMQNILDKSAGFSPEKINLVSHLLIDLFERMNYKTPNANSMVFTVSIFKALETLNVSNIDRDQVQYLVSKFKYQLSPDQYNLLKVIFNKVDKIAFTHSSDTQSTLKIETVDNKPITIKNNDIPVLDLQTKEYINKYINNIEIANGTSMSFTDQKSIDKSTNSKLAELEYKSFIVPTVVEVNGIVVSGQFPILGNITVTPKKLDVNIDSQTPVKADVGFKKGFLGMTYTFNLNN